MINQIIQFSLKNKGVVAFFTIALIIFGIVSLFQLPIDAVPDITNNQVQIITNTPTLATQEVEQFVTTPIERTMASLPDVEEIRSISRFGLSLITIVFDDKVDIYFGRQLVAQRLTDAVEEIPRGVGKPEMAPVSTGLGEIYQYILHTSKGYENKYSATDLRTMQDWIVARQLIGTPGVAEVNSFGGMLKQYEVSLDPLRLKSLNITIPEVFKALESNNENTGGAYIEKKPSAYFIRGLGLVTSLDDIRNIVIKTNSTGIPVLIGDVATVQFGNAIRYGSLTRNGEGEVVGGIVMMLKGANSAEVVEAVKKKIPTIQKSLPTGIVIEPFLDRTTLVNRAIGTVEKNLIEGALIVIFILVLFLGNLRAGLIVSSVIPLSMLFAVILMNAFGVTGNLMSLGAIDFGLIVDGAVIIVEAVLHKILHSRYHEKGIIKLDRHQMDHEVKQSATQLMSSATFGQLIILIVYLPILSLIGIEGKMFRPMAMTVSFAIIGALLLSLTYVPMMSAVFLPRKYSGNKTFSDRMMEKIQAWYAPTIKLAMKRTKLVILCAVILLSGAIILFTRMGGEFIPTLEEGDFAFHNILPGDASLSQSIENNSKVEKILLQFPEVKEVVGKTGSAEIPTDPMPPNFTDVIVVLKEKKEWKTAKSREELQDTMVKALQQIPGVFFEASQPIQMRFNELMTGVRQDIAIKIFGENIDTLVQYGNRAAQAIANIPGVTAPQVEKISGLPQISIKYDRSRIAQYGLNIAEINRIVRAAFAGEVAGQVYENERRFDLVVRLEASQRQDIDNVRQLFVPIPSGGQVPLVQIANVDYENGPAQISREDAKRRIVIGVNTRGRDVESAVNEIRTTLEQKVKLPSGYYYSYGGQFENLQKASNRLMIAVPIALLLIYVLLFFTFHSLKQALLIYSAIPLSAIGGVIALWFRDMPFSISAGVGFIALFGVAVLNGIVLISTFNQLEKDGIQDVEERVIVGTRTRLRPVLMTAAVASLGFIPMAVSTSAGAEVQKPLATVVIGGLITATALTLIVLPVLYILFNKKTKAKQFMVSILVFVMACSSANAQSEIKLSLDSCISLAMQNNLNIQSGDLKTLQQKSLQKTAINLGNTGIFYENEDLVKDVDNKGILKIGFEQSIQFPTVYHLQKKVNVQNTEVAKSNMELTRREVVKQVSIAYFNLLYSIERIKLMKELDSTFSKIEDAASLRFSTGETAKLELISAQAKRKEIQLSLAESTQRMTIEQNYLSLLLNNSVKILPLDTGMTELKSPAVVSSSATHPLLSSYEQRMRLSTLQRKLSYHKLLPDFNFRYFNQNWFGISPGYYGYSIGIGIPLFFWTQQGNIQATKYQEKISEVEFKEATLSFNNEYQKALLNYESKSRTMEYYTTIGNGQAFELRNSAMTAFKEGELSYIEFISLLSQSISIRDASLKAINEYNQSVIELNYYTK